MASPAPQHYDSTDTILQTTLIPTGVITGGNTYGPTVTDLWNDKGGILGSTNIQNARVIVQADAGAGWVTSGLQVLDEGWVFLKISGTKNPGADPTLANQDTGYIPLSTFNPVLLSDIPKNCARIFNTKIVVPPYVGDIAVNVRLALAVNQTVIPLSALTSLAFGGGVIPDRINYSRRILTGYPVSATPFITASGGATVDVAARWFSFDGYDYFAIPKTVTLNQTSGSGALGVGESYIAVLSQPAISTIPTITKGNKGAAPATPATPANEIYLGKVTVTYQGGGTSIINQGNVDLTAVIFGNLFISAATGLTATVGSGRAITSSDVELLSTAPAAITLPDNTNPLYIYINTDGTINYDASGSFPARSDGKLILGYTPTAGGNIATGNLFQDPCLIGRAIDWHTLMLAFRGPLAVGTSLSWDALFSPMAGILEYAWQLERVHIAVGVNGSGAGSTKFDIKYIPAGSLGSGATIYTSQGTVDYRPALTNNGYLLDGAYIGSARHEVRKFDDGTIFSLDCVSVTAVPPIDVTAKLIFRRLR